MAADKRVAFVTGGTKGIGYATAIELANAGHSVAVGSRSKPDTLDDRLTWINLDVTNVDSVETGFSQLESTLGSADILVTSAGITNDTLLMRMDEDRFTQVIDANLTGTFRCVKRSLGPMMKQKWGRIVMLSSVVARLGQVGQANYAASKAGVEGFARTVAREYARRNITVNVVAPGPIDTDMLGATPERAVEAMTQAVPMARVGSPSEVAAAISFLTSDEASYITGVTLPVDGGLGM